MELTERFKTSTTQDLICSPDHAYSGNLVECTTAVCSGSPSQPNRAKSVDQVNSVLHELLLPAPFTAVRTFSAKSLTFVNYIVRIYSYYVDRATFTQITPYVGWPLRLQNPAQDKVCGWFRFHSHRDFARFKHGPLTVRRFPHYCHVRTNECTELIVEARSSLTVN